MLIHSEFFVKTDKQDIRKQCGGAPIHLISIRRCKLMLDTLYRVHIEA